MNQDEVIKLARDAGYGWSAADMHFPALAKFAQLVLASRKPLTDEQIAITAAPHFGGVCGFRATEFARAIEAAHGIKEQA